PHLPSFPTRRSSDLATDAVARFGGEEFAVILPGTSEPDARQVAESIRLALAALKIPTGNETISLTASLGGVSLIPRQEGTARDIIKLADDALYRAKHEGRNRCNFAPISGLSASEELPESRETGRDYTTQPHSANA